MILAIHYPTIVANKTSSVNLFVIYGDIYPKRNAWILGPLLDATRLGVLQLQNILGRDQALGTDHKCQRVHQTPQRRRAELLARHSDSSTMKSSPYG